MTAADQKCAFLVAVLKGLTRKREILAAWRDGRIPDERAQLLIEQFGLEDIEEVAGGA